MTQAWQDTFALLGWLVAGMLGIITVMVIGLMFAAVEYDERPRRGRRHRVV